MTSVEIDLVRYQGNRFAAERAGSSLVTGLSGDFSYLEKPSQDIGLKQVGTLTMHENTSRESELFMLEEAAVRIQRAYRMRKKRRIQF